MAKQCHGEPKRPAPLMSNNASPRGSLSISHGSKSNNKLRNQWCKILTFKHFIVGRPKRVDRHIEERVVQWLPGYARNTGSFLKAWGRRVLLVSDGRSFNQGHITSPRRSTLNIIGLIRMTVAIYYKQWRRGVSISTMIQLFDSYTDYRGGKFIP